MGAVKTVASALQFGVDALERGLINTVLSVKLRHAPPMFILQTLADPTFTERGFSKTYSAYSTGVSGILCRISRSSMDSSISVLMWCLWQFLTTINVRCLLGLLPSP